jgi:hypothetical protein
MIGIRDRKVMPLGILEQNADEFAAMLLLDLVKIDFASLEESFEALKVRRKERNFGEKVCRRRRGHFFERDALSAGKKQESGRNVLAVLARMIRIDEFLVELVSLRDIHNKNRDAGDSQNARALRRLALRNSAETEEQTREQQCDLFHALTLGI